MKNKGIIVKLAIALLTIGIFIGRAVLTESSIRIYMAPVGILVILFLVHIFMPDIAELPGDNPKVKTMRRLNILTAIVIVGIFFTSNFFTESTSGNEDKFILPFSVAIVILVGNAAPKLPINSVMGIRRPWTRRDPDTWKAAHRALGYCTFPLALIMIVGGALIDPVVFSVGGLLAFGLIPSVYSFLYSLKKGV